MGSDFIYRLYGLTIRSFIEILGAPQLNGFEHYPVDVSIQPGSVPDSLPAPLDRGVLYQFTAEKFLLNVDPIARFLVTGGKEITVELLSQKCDAETQVFLLGPVFGALLHQRGLLALHGSAIVSRGGAVIILGQSAAGKSTLAAALQQRGYPILTDEICAIARLPDGDLAALPGYAQLSLWADALAKLGIDPGQLSRLRPGMERYLLPPAEWLHDPAPIQTIYELRLHNQADLILTQPSNLEKFNLVKDHTYMRRFIIRTNAQAAHFHLVSQAASVIPIKRIARPVYPPLLQELADLIEKDFH